MEMLTMLMSDKLVETDENMIGNVENEHESCY